MRNQATAPPHRLLELRHAANESRVELAHALGFKSTKPVERWEQGQDIPIYHARVIAQRYAVSVGYLLGDGEDVAA